jgi:hypothetical protein
LTLCKLGAIIKLSQVLFLIGVSQEEKVC